MDPINEKEIGFSGTGAPAGVNEVKDKESLGGENAMEVKVDKHELPLVPQPSAHEDDPLVYPAIPSETDLLTYAELVSKSQTPHLYPNQLARSSWPHELCSHQPRIRSSWQSIPHHDC